MDANSHKKCTPTGGKPVCVAYVQCPKCAEAEVPKGRREGNNVSGRPQETY